MHLISVGSTDGHNGLIGSSVSFQVSVLFKHFMDKGGYVDIDFPSELQLD